MATAVDIPEVETVAAQLGTTTGLAFDNVGVVWGCRNVMRLGEEFSACLLRKFNIQTISQTRSADTLG